MKKKIIAISILAVFMLVTISIVTAVGTTHTAKPVEKKGGSPLFGIRTRRAIAVEEKIGELKASVRDGIKAWFVNREFFLPFQWHMGGDYCPEECFAVRDQLGIKTNGCTYPWQTCYPNNCL